MGLFNTKEQNELVEQNERQQKRIFDLEAEIRMADAVHLDSMNRAEARFAVVKSNLESQIEVLEGAANRKTEKFETTVAAEVARRVKSFKEDFERTNTRDLSAIKKELKAEYESKIKSLENELNQTNEDAYEALGQLSGAKDTISILKNQVESLTSMLKTITDKVVSGLPEVSATITTPEVSLSLPKVNNEKK